MAKENSIKIKREWENQYGGGVGTLRLLAQPELTENRTARGSDTKEIKNKHLSRLVGGAEMGTGVERQGKAVAGGLGGPTFICR